MCEKRPPLIVSVGLGLISIHLTSLLSLCRSRSFKGFWEIEFWRFWSFPLSSSFILSVPLVRACICLRLCVSVANAWQYFMARNDENRKVIKSSKINKIICQIVNACSLPLASGQTHPSCVSWHWCSDEICWRNISRNQTILHTSGSSGAQEGHLHQGDLQLYRRKC